MNQAPRAAKEPTISGSGDRRDRLLSTLRSLQEDSAFADLKLYLGTEVEGGEEVPASGILLAGLSPVFRNILQHDMVEKRERKIRLQHVSVKAWDVITKFYFSGEKLVTADNIKEIITAAHMYDLTDLLDHCEKELPSLVTPDNCLEMLQLSRLYTLVEANVALFKFARDNFDDVCMTEGFLALAEEDLLDFFQCSYLVTAEDTLCLAILNWLEKNSTDDNTMAYIFGRVKLQDVSKWYLLRQISCHSLVLRTGFLREVVEEEIVRRRFSSDIHFPCPVAPYERVPKVEDRIIVLGHDGGQMRAFEAKERLSEWKSLPTTKTGDGFAACMFGRSLYITGGYLDGKATQIFHLDSGAWSRGPNLVYSRHQHDMVSIGDTVYAIMGRDRHALNTIEGLQGESEKWTCVGRMPNAAYSCGAVAVQDLIIVLGAHSMPAPSVLQAFNVRTTQTFVVNVDLPKTIGVVRGTGTEGMAVFVGGDGSLFRVFYEGKSSLSVSRKRLHKHVRHGSCGVLADRELVTFGLGGEYRVMSSSVDCFSLDGHALKNRNMVSLPMAMNVIKAFRVSPPES